MDDAARNNYVSELETRLIKFRANMDRIQALMQELREALQDD